ncbi:MAG: PIN domain-containing protein [Labilithrix sp.]|nr:PIN domain-containing protein [Labilithrix sp.]
MAFVVLYDACVLYPAPLRDLLIRLANTGIVRARWSEAILDECFRNIQEQRPDLKPEALQRTRELMKKAVANCMVTGFESLIEGITLPDPDDRHVLAAAIRVGAQAIVTFNLRDFPKETLSQYEVEAQPPDDFVLDTNRASPGWSSHSRDRHHGSIASNGDISGVSARWMKPAREPDWSA